MAAYPEPAGTGLDAQGSSWREIADAVWLAAMTHAVGGGTATTPARGTAADRPPQHPGRLDVASPAAPVVGPPISRAGAPGASQRHRDPRYGVPEPDDPSDTMMAAALPGSRQIARALKPFKKRVLSTTETEPDEDATAEHAVDVGVWLPRYRPVPARWLALVLVVDESPSMAVWRPTASAFRLLLERHGSFRAVRTFFLSTPDEAGFPPGARLRGPTGGARDPAELLDPTGRQVFLVLTDGIGPLWTDPSADRLLRLWGSSGPLVLVNPFPQRHWRHGNLSPRRCLLRAPHPAVPNSALRVRYPDELANPFDEPVSEQSLAVPLIELSARWLRWWAGLVAESSGWVDAVVHAVDPSTPPPLPQPTAPGSAADLVIRFRASASPTAFRLATYLAAAPLELPLLHRIRRTLLPDSAPYHLAELITSDLVRPESHASFEFVDGVREALLACTTRDDSAKAVRAVAAHHRHVVALTRTIEAPDRTPEPSVTAATLPMARIELAVLNALSGPYAGRAHRLSRAVAAVEQGMAGPDDPPNPQGDGPDTHSVTSGGPLGGGPEDGENMAAQPESTQPEPSRPGGDIDPFAIWAYPGEDLGPAEEHLLSEDDPLQELLDGHSHETGPVVWGNVPTRNPVFTGRRALLEQLDRRLRTESVAAVLPQALHGEGGVGKSQIAIEYAYRHRDDYDVIWWVPSERPAQILASLIELGNKLGLDVGNEVITAVPRVRDALRAGTPYSNWLLVFDNAENPDTVKDYLPEAGTGRVLVTSRNQEWSQIAETLEVDVFTRRESIRLLQRRNQQLSAVDADRLADALGDLPLAIEHASAWLFATGMAVGDYLELLAQKRAELTALVPAPRYEMPVAAAANVALDRLATENPAALQLLQVCSFFAPEPISRDLFTGARSTMIAEELDEALQNPSRLNQAIRSIQRYVLARVDHRADTLQLHRLVRAVLQSRMPPEQRARMEHGAHILLAGGGKPGDPSDSQQWLRYQALASHLIASNALTCDDDWARDLVINLVRFYFYWGDYASGRDLARRVVDKWRGKLGADHRQTLQVAKLLGYYWWVEGDFAAAAEIQADTLRRYQRTIGPDDEGTIDAMGMVASTLRISGQFAAARDLDLEAFQRSRRIIGEDEPSTLTAAHNLGVSLRLTGEFRTARRLDTDTYRRRVAVLGNDHPETLRTLNSLTIDVRECGEYLRARRLVERIYAQYLSLFGIGHQETIRVARNFAVALRRAGDHEKAYKLAEDTMNRFRDRFGPTHPDAIAAALDFAVDIREAGDLARAQVLAAQTAEWYRAVLGAEHPYTLYARTNLGIVLRLLGRPQEAYEHSQTAWTTLERVLGPSHVLTLTCAINLASDRSALGDHQGAYELDMDMLRRSRLLMGAEHPSTLACALNLSFDLAALHRSTESAALFDDTLAAYQRVLGANHPAITAARTGARANCDVDPMQF